MAKATLKKVDVELKFPFVGSLTGTWEADEAQQVAAWEMYVELVTRVTVVPLRDHEGLLREALTSLHSLFGTTRKILRSHGPGVARPAKPERLSFATIAVAVLNRALRPVLAKWHPLLLDHESARPPGVSAFAHEQGWSEAPNLRGALADVRRTLTAYASLLADAAGVASLVDD